MWLINTDTLALEEFIGPKRPPFAILSHTWGKEEVTFQEVRSAEPNFKHKLGGRKIVNTCAIAKQRGFRYVWIDSCCIDKTNSVELTEAINSMFEWYAAAAECYAYIQDLDASAPIEALQNSRWFSRGWTLQELLAPDILIFFDQYWWPRGTKRDLSLLISEATGISPEILQDTRLLSQTPVAHKMSWAASRQTTRPEDIAYCLIGIFDVKMVFIYGEGRESAFYRLQEEIIRRTNDMSIFAWRSVSSGETYRGVLASGPEEFLDGPLYRRTRGSLNTPEYTVTNKGIRIHTHLHYTPFGESVLSLHHSQHHHGTVGIYLKAHGGGTYARTRPHELAKVADSTPRGRVDQRYLSPSVSAATKRALDTTLHNAFFFNASLNTNLWQYESTSPDTWWDRDTRSYLRDGNKPFTAFHFFRSDWHDVTSSRKFVVAFGVTNSGRAWARIDAGSLYNAAVEGRVHMVEEQVQELIQSDQNFKVQISRWNPPVLVETCTTENGRKVCKDTLQTTTSIFCLKVLVVKTVVNGHATFVINMTAEEPEVYTMRTLFVLFVLLVILNFLQR